MPKTTMVRAALLCIGLGLGFVPGDGRKSRHPPRLRRPAWIESLRPQAERLDRRRTHERSRLSPALPAVRRDRPPALGPAALDRAIEWAAGGDARGRLESVRLQAAMVPAWVRGDEHAEMVEPGPQKLAMVGLRAQRRNTRRRDHRRGGGGEQLRRAGLAARRGACGAASSSTTSPFRELRRDGVATAAQGANRARAARGGGGAGALDRPGEPAHAAHRRHGQLRGQHPEDPGRRGHASRMPP